MEVNHKASGNSLDSLLLSHQHSRYSTAPRVEEERDQTERKTERERDGQRRRNLTRKRKEMVGEGLDREVAGLLR